MERTAYNLLRDGVVAASAKGSIRARYGIENARWIQSAINQAKAVLASQEDGIGYRVEMYEEKDRNTEEKKGRLSNSVKVEGCKMKVARLRTRIDDLKAQLADRSYPKAIFGSRRLYHQLSIARGERRKELHSEWRRRRSNHFFSIGQAN
jgi:hypothetical protein